jgi:hypothetical protein
MIKIACGKTRRVNLEQQPLSMATNSPISGAAEHLVVSKGVGDFTISILRSTSEDIQNAFETILIHMKALESTNTTTFSEVKRRSWQRSVVESWVNNILLRIPTLY